MRGERDMPLIKSQRQEFKNAKGHVGIILNFDCKFPRQKCRL